MASMIPSEEEISQVIDFASLNPVDDRDMVLIALKNNNRNVETVVMQYFDNAALFRQRYSKVWDDNAFSGEREGPENQAGISFHVESPDQNYVIQGVTPPPEGFRPGAPSRPPSRTTSKSPLGSVAEWVATEAQGASSSQTQEDEDMARALRESAQEAGIKVPQQETGVVDDSTATPFFGKAERENYDQGNWALVPSEQPQTALVVAPRPSSRKREDGAPAFLLQGYNATGQHRLGGLVTILHQIPLARNILLQCGDPALSYGHNSEWWNGQEILPPHVLSALQSGDLRWGNHDTAKPIFEEELHRLMAFLDLTERGYGTVSVLNDLLPYPGAGPERQFYERLAEGNGEIIRPLSQVAVLGHVQSVSVWEEEARFGLLEMEHGRDDYASIKTIYEAIDHVMWSDVLSWLEVNDDSKMAMFKDMGELLAVKFAGDGPESLEIPTELYPERWLASRKDEAKRIQLAICETKKAVSEIEESARNLYEWRDAWNTKVWNKRDLIKKACELWKTYGEYLEGSARFQAMERAGFNTDKYPDYRSAPCDMEFAEANYYDKTEEVVLWAEEVLEKLEEKLKNSRMNLDQIRVKQRFLGQLLTVPDKPSRPKPMACKKYLLRGVVGAPNTIYVCVRAEPDLIELDDAPKKRDQWWMLAYDDKEKEPVLATKVGIEGILKDLWQETQDPLLIYATEAALDAPRVPLSSQLERFVKADNKAFRQELNSEKDEGGTSKQTATVETMSPSKRKHRSDSMDSVDSNRASVGSDEANGFDDPFADQMESEATEMRDMSQESNSRIARDAGVEAAKKFSVQDLRTFGSSAAMGDAQIMTPQASPDAAAKLQRQADGAEERADDSRTMTPETEEVKGPEMEERSRPRPLIRRSTEGETSSNNMDMEIPDHQD